MADSASDLVYGVDDVPRLPVTVITAVQHLLAIFIGISTPPLIICGVLGAGPAETAMMVNLALFVSGLATIVQTRGIGPIGSRLLAIQGTSFAFIGPVLFARDDLTARVGADQVFGTLFGTAAVGALGVVALSFYLDRLHRLITPVVTAATVALLGLSLIEVDVESMLSQHRAAPDAATRYRLWGLFTMTAGTVCALQWAGSPRLKLIAIGAGFAVGYLASLVLGVLDFSGVAQAPLWVTPQPLRFRLGFDPFLFVAFAPAYLVSLTESIGDLTATSALSRRPVAGHEYTRTIRRGVLADGLNSLLAALFCTFPNATFSQNNGVIRMTGIASRAVGIWVGILLVVVGLVPTVGAVLGAMPRPVLDGLTIVLFVHVTLAGARILKVTGADRRAWLATVAAIAGGYLVAAASSATPGLPALVRAVLEYPVAAGAMLALGYELVRIRHAPAPTALEPDER